MEPSARNHRCGRRGKSASRELRYVRRADMGSSGVLVRGRRMWLPSKRGSALWVGKKKEIAPSRRKETEVRKETL
jgi:hypothetical protein